MLLETNSASCAGVKVELFGSDLSERALEKAQAGLYTQFEVQRGLPIRLLVRHFEKTTRLGRCRRASARWCAGGGST